MNLLIVIDMQPEFEISALPIRGQVKDIIKAHRGTTLFVEYQGCGPTYRDLISAARFRYKVLKDSDDGSSEIMEWTHRSHREPHTVGVVGVNTNCCVLETVSGLRSHWPLRVLARGCNSESKEDHAIGLRLLGRMRNVKVVA